MKRTTANKSPPKNTKGTISDTNWKHKTHVRTTEHMLANEKFLDAKENEIEKENGTGAFGNLRYINHKCRRRITIYNLEDLDKVTHPDHLATVDYITQTSKNGATSLK